MDKSKDYRNIEQQRIDSGKSVKEFCVDLGIRPSLYYYWRKKQQEEDESSFHHISVASRGPGSGIRIIYPNGVQVEVYGEMNMAQIRSLIDVRL